MKSFIKLAVVASLAGVSTMAFAAGDPIAERKAMMKSVGAATGASAAMVKGQADFDPRVAMLALRTMNAVALGFSAKFPEGSESGGKTTASPKIWEDSAGFAAAVAKFEADTAAALAAPAGDIDAFKAQFGAVAANCSSCHQDYRVKN